jgi:hypothetical protein
LAFRDEKEKTDYKDFHGNRDFYNLIKNTMKYLKEEKGREGEENTRAGEFLHHLRLRYAVRCRL